MYLYTPYLNYSLTLYFTKKADDINIKTAK